MTADSPASNRLGRMAAGMSMRDPSVRPERGIVDWPRAIPADDARFDALARQREAPAWGALGSLYRTLSGEDATPHRHLLLLHFILANAVALALVGAAAGQGWIGALLAADEGGLCRMIIAVFLVGLVWSAQRALELSRELNHVGRLEAFPGASVPEHLRLGARGDAQSRALLASSLRLRLPSRIAPVRHLANSLVLLGLIGTVVGFIMALSGVRPEVASDVEAVGPMVSTLIGGASWFLGVSEWLFGALLFLGFWNKKLGILGALGSCVAFLTTVTIIPFMPGGWAASAGGFPAMTGNIPFLMKDVVLLAVSVYLLKQDVLRAGLPAAHPAHAQSAVHTVRSM
jgi:hypothetical protein